MPEGVASIGGELYFSDMVPGSGFVASIGLDATSPAGGATEAVGTAGAAGMTPPSVTSTEKQQIMDLFETNKP